MCQIKYDGGWKDKSHTISACTYNAAKLIKDYDIFGLQEVDLKYRTKFVDTIKLLRSDINFKFIYGNGIMTGYNVNKTGEGMLLSPPNFLLVDRGMQVIWFEKLNLIFINLHAPHKINLKLEIEKNCNKITLPKSPKLIIMTGDFNDYSGNLIESHLTIFGKRVEIPYKRKLLTCCTDSNYSYPGDYIFTTKYNEGYYGYPEGYKRGEPLISDHDPVVYILDY